MTQKRMLASQSQNLPLDHGTLDIIIFQNDILLQTLDSKVSLDSIGTHLGQKHFSEAAFAKHF